MRGIVRLIRDCIRTPKRKRKHIHTRKHKHKHIPKHIHIHIHIHVHVHVHIHIRRHNGNGIALTRIGLVSLHCSCPTAMSFWRRSAEEERHMFTE
jgi:hypothetical protein